MLFLITFSVVIALLTITELPIIVFLLRSPFLILFLLSKVSFLSTKFSFARHSFLVVSGACFLALGSWQFYQLRYVSPTQESRYLSRGTIVDSISSGRYLYADDKSEYALYTSKNYIPGNQIRLVARKSIKPSILAPLSSITAESVFYSGFNGPKWSKMKGYSNILYETNSVLLETGSLTGFSKIRYLLRQRLEQTYQNKKTAGLVLGMLIGDKSLFSKPEYQLFIDSGLVHLVAVSGGNIVMLVTFLTAILFFVPFYIRIILILLAVIAYGIMCGMDSSVLRAVLMGALSLVALLVGKGASLRRLLALVYIGMLIYNPYFLVYDVGYLLSFSAVLGIIFIDVIKSDPETDPKLQSEKTEKQKPTRFHKYIKNTKNAIIRIYQNYLKPSIGATLGIFPVIIFFMGQINIAGIIGNMFVLPVVPLIMIGGFIGGFLPSRLQKYYVPIIDLLVARNYKIAAIIDQYGLTIVAEAQRIKFLLFAISIIMIIVVIWTLTNQELATTSKDKQPTNLDNATTLLYDDILDRMPVEISKKS